MQKINEIEKIGKMDEEFTELELFKFNNLLEKYDEETIK